MHNVRILILYPDRAGLALLTSMLKSLGHIIEEATTDRVAVQLMERNNIDLVLAGVDPLDGEVLELLTYLRRKHREVPVILLFPRLHSEQAREALRLGAMAVLKYPVPAAELRAAVLQALELCEARGPEPFAAAAPQASGAAKPPARPPAATFISPVARGSGVTAPGACSQQRLAHLPQGIGLVGNDSSWRRVIDLAGTIAATRTSVLVMGEPGTGKSLLARLIHALGPNPERPFISVEAPAMTGEASSQEPHDTSYPTRGQDPQDWANKLAHAQGGTLEFDEVAALPLEFQLHLLRELQFRDDQATADHSTPSEDTRFLVCTSEDLPSLIEQGRFCHELYHRIGVLRLMLPPLRRRGTDVELLAEWFRAHYAREFHKTIAGFTRDALDVLQKHDWPGNVRELEAAVQRAVALCDGPRITSSHLAPILNHHRQVRSVSGATLRPHLKVGIRTLKEALEESEKRIIIQALQAFNWNRHKTARVLEIERTTLYKKMKKYNLLIDEPAWANSAVTVSTR